MITIVLVLVVGAGAFFAGMKYADMQRTQGRLAGNRQFQMGPNGPSGQPQGQGRMSGRPVTGEIIKIDDTTITVKTQDGGSKIIMLSGTTTYSKTAESSKADLAVGTTIGVFGTENTDKSITAQNIQLNPQFRLGSMPTPSK